MEKAIRLNPTHPAWYQTFLGLAYFMMKADDNATMAFKQSVRLNPNFLLPHIFLAIAHSRRDNDSEAQIEVAEVLRISPNYTLERFSELIPIADQAIMVEVQDSLRKAGLR